MAITTVVKTIAEEGPAAENDDGIRSVDAYFTLHFLANSIAVDHETHLGQWQA